jgi:aryl-alcohol dehydrogenase-like predicted oxidoreductase
MSQLDDNLNSAEVELTADEVVSISKITQPSQIYPEWMIDFQSQVRK